MAPNILVVQHSQLDPIGVLGEHLVRRGATLSTWLTETQAAPPSGNYAGLIILGGSMNAHEDQKFSHLRQTVDLVREFHRKEKPILGICLGAQLIARAFGSSVYPHRVPELGFSPVFKVGENLSEPWLNACSEKGISLMQWHFDTFELPVGAALLMTNDVCENQAYRISDNVYGFQFHFEVTPEIVMDWLADKSDWVEKNYPRLDAKVEEQVKAYAQQSAWFAGEVAKDWLSLVPQPVAV